MGKEMTERALEANRRNAARSTGPKTPEGKATVARNRLLHGLRAWADIVPGEDADEYQRLQDSLLGEFQPYGEMEHALTARIGSCLWRLWRAQRLEAGLLYREKEGALKKIVMPPMTLTQRFKELAGEAPETKGTEVRAPENLEAWGLAWARCCGNGNAIIDKLGKYEGGLERSLFKTMHELERLQRRRRGEETPAPEALDITIDASTL